MNGHRFIYLAYPVDQANPYTELIRPVVDRAKAEIELRGYGWYDAGAAFGGTTGFYVPPGAEIYKVDHRAQSLCTATLALLPPGVPSIGVPGEIHKAATGWGMPCAVVGGDGSWALPGGVEQFSWPANELQTRIVVGKAVDRLLRQPAQYYGDRGTSELRFERLNRPADPGTSPLDADQPRLPTRAYPDDAGLDLYVSERVVVPPGDFRDIPTGVAVELPPHCWGYLTGRSSTLRNLSLLVNPGVIDAGYRGELFAGVWNLSSRPVVVEAGQRIAQLIILNNATRDHMPVWGSLSPHDRGQLGFGSSGE